MMKLIAVTVLTLRVSCAYAFGWDDAVKWVSGWFSTGTATETRSADVLPENIASKWDKLSDTLNDALTLRDKQETLPVSSWFGEDRASNGRKIDALLDRALMILSDGNGTARADALRLKSEINGLRGKLDKLRNDRINAPEKTYLFWRDTKSSIDAEIAETERKISRAESELSEINARISDELSELGIDITAEQAGVLMNSVTGSDIIHNTVIFENVKAVVTKLEDLSRHTHNTQEITKRYAGLYVVLNDILICTQEDLVRKIDDSYRPKLDAIITEADTLRREALKRSNDKAYTSQQRKSFALNAKSNSDTINAARMYGKLLDAQRLSLMNSIKALRLNRDLAENTYRTVRSSVELREMIHSGLDAIDAVMRLSMPELKVFEGETFRAEFDEISRRLGR